jgi:hypothetical protein
MGVDLKAPTTQTGGELLVRALDVAESYVHFASYTLDYASVLQLASLARRIPVKGIVNTVGSDARAAIEDFGLEGKLEVIESPQMPHRLLLVDGVVGFRPTSSLLGSTERLTHEKSVAVTNREDLRAFEREFVLVWRANEQRGVEHK